MTKTTLPSEWQPPFEYGTIKNHTEVGIECLHDANDRCMVFDCGEQTGKFLAALLNAVYGGWVGKS